MRRAFVQTLCEMAAADKRIVLLTGDLGYMALEPFRARFPERFFNAGVAEQNMVGVATGLAEAGYRPYVYSIAPFASLRPFEFIRNGPVLHRLPVRIVGMGMGFDYGHAGSTHYALEDVVALRALPGLSIVVPADSRHAAALLLATAGEPGPVYYSLSKNDSLHVEGLDVAIGPGRLQTIRPGCDVVILTMGSMVTEVLAAAKALEAEEISAAVAVVSGFNPDPWEDTARLLAGFRRAITVEAQAVSGGLGAFVAAVIAGEGIACRLRSLGLRVPPGGSSGSERDRWQYYGLDISSIAEAAR